MVDGFAFKPAANRRGFIDDAPNRQLTLWGVCAKDHVNFTTWALVASARVSFEATTHHVFVNRLDDNWVGGSALGSVFTLRIQQQQPILQMNIVQVNKSICQCRSAHFILLCKLDQHFIKLLPI
jgi:hypothetical protein